MKRYLTYILLASALVGLGSCNKTPVPELPGDSDVVLEFGSTIVTRSAEAQTVNGKIIPAGQSFGVFGWYGDAISGTPRYMDNQMVTNTGTEESSRYTYAPKRYWPDEGALAFTAYYPYETGTNDTGISFADDKTSFSFSVKPDAADQVDFLVADTFTSPTVPANYTLDLHFRHALSKINVLFRYDPETVRDDERARPLGIALENVCMTGSCVPGPVWSNLSGKGRTTFGLTGGDASACLLIPQETAPLSFVIDARIEKVQGGEVTDYRDKHCVVQVPCTEEAGGVASWTNGIVYTYELYFNGDQVKVELVDITVDNWNKAADWKNSEFSNWMDEE